MEKDLSSAYRREAFSITCSYLNIRIFNRLLPCFLPVGFDKNIISNREIQLKSSVGID